MIANSHCARDPEKSPYMRYMFAPHLTEQNIWAIYHHLTPNTVSIGVLSHFIVNGLPADRSTVKIDG